MLTYFYWQDAKGEWRWYLWSPNGKKVATAGESYHNKADCLHAIGLVKNSSDSPVEEAR